MCGILSLSFHLLLWTGIQAINTEVYIQTPVGQLICRERNHKTGKVKSVVHGIKHLSCILEKSTQSGTIDRTQTHNGVFTEAEDSNTVEDVLVADSSKTQPELTTEDVLAADSSKTQPELTTEDVLAADSSKTHPKLTTADAEDPSKTYPKLTTEDANAEDPSKTHPKLTTETSPPAHMQLTTDIRNMNLHMACEEGKLDIVKYILSHRPEDINCRGESGITPVMAAARKGQSAVFHYLVNKGCDLSALNSRDVTVLHFACEGGSADIVRNLIAKKCDVECRDEAERRPIMWAALSAQKEVFDLLVNIGCNLTAVDVSLCNILHFACLGGHVGIVQCILSQDLIDIESKDWKGTTPVMFAVECGRKEVFDLLVRKGCSLMAVSNEKNTLLHSACIGGDLRMVKHLMTWKAVKGMERVKNIHRRTPVQEAEIRGHVKVASLLNS